VALSLLFDTLWRWGSTFYGIGRLSPRTRRLFKLLLQIEHTKHNILMWKQGLYTPPLSSFLWVRLFDACGFFDGGESSAWSFRSGAGGGMVRWQEYRWIQNSFQIQLVPFLRLCQDGTSRCFSIPASSDSQSI